MDSHLMMNSNHQHQHSHEDAAASIAPTPARKCVKDFFQKISADEYIKIQEAQIAVLSEADIMDLRSVQVRDKKRHVVRTSKKRCEVRSANATEGSAHWHRMFPSIITSFWISWRRKRRGWWRRWHCWRWCFRWWRHWQWISEYLGLNCSCSTSSCTNCSIKWLWWLCQSYHNDLFAHLIIINIQNAENEEDDEEHDDADDDANADQSESANEIEGSEH